jgi:hypothetical protein
MGDPLKNEVLCVADLTELRAFIERRPVAIFVAFATLHFVVWTALPTLILFNPFRDVIEALTYGREWQLGYNKLTPLPWWLVEFVHQVFHYDVSYYALSQVAVIAAFTAIWFMGRAMLGASRALVAVLLLDGVNYFHFIAVKFNHDVIQLPIWAFAGFMYWRALRRDETVNWILLGIAAGLAVWAKYFVVVLALPLSLFLLFDRDARKRLATPGPYLALLVALLIVLPHLIWLVQHDYAPFQYANAEWQPFRGQSDRILYPARFLVEQLWYLLPMALIALPLFLPKGTAIADTITGFDRRIVTLLAFGPAATLAIISAVTGRGPQTMWGYPLWLFLGLWCVTVSTAALDYPRLTRVVSLWMSVFVAFGIGYFAEHWAIPIFKTGYYASFQGFMPGRELAAQVVERYRKLTGQAPPYVIGSMWIGGTVSHYTPSRPRVLLDGIPEHAPWIDISDLRSKGAVVVWTSTDSDDTLRSDTQVLPSLIRDFAKGAEVQEPFMVPYRRGPAVAKVGWAVLLGQGTEGAGSKSPSGAVNCAAPDFTADVTQLYRVLLGREPDEEGLKNWSKVAAQTCSLDAVRVGIINSEEYKERTK